MVPFSNKLFWMTGKRICLASSWSPCIRESKTVLDSGFQVLEVDFLSVELGFQIP